MNLYSAFLYKKKNPKRAACSSLVEIEEKGFEVAPKRWKRKTIVSKVSRKWVPVWRAGVCKWTPSVGSKFHTWEVEMTTVSRSQVATTRNAGDGLAVGRQVFRSHLVQYLNTWTQTLDRTRSTTSSQCSFRLTFHSKYEPIAYRFQDIVRYWPKTQPLI